jgi:hypothetical protein
MNKNSISFYEFVENQTFNQRKEFVSKLKEKGFNRQQISNWIGKISSIPDKHQTMVSQIAGQELTFPRLVRKVFIESEA